MSFSNPAVPSDLPGSSSIEPAFETTAGFSADSATPVQPMEVNPGESVGILFSLKDEQTFADVLAQIYRGSEDLWREIVFRSDCTSTRLGPKGGSDSFIMTPVPGALILGLLGLSVARTNLRESNTMNSQ